MKIRVMGPDSASFFEALDAAQIRYELQPPNITGPMNSVGDVVNLLPAAVAVAALKTIDHVIVAWLKANGNRQVNYTYFANGRLKTANFKGLSPDEVSRLMQEAKSIDVIARK